MALVSETHGTGMHVGGMGGDTPLQNTVSENLVNKKHAKIF